MNFEISLIAGGTTWISLKKIKGLLLEPSKTFDALKEEPLEGAVKYYNYIAAVYSALIAIMLGFAGIWSLVMEIIGIR